MDDLKELESELALAKKFKFEKCEIEKLERLVAMKRKQILQSSLRHVRRAQWNLRSGNESDNGFLKIFVWIIAIILMALISFSIHPQGEENLPDETEYEISPSPSLRKRGSSFKKSPKEEKKDFKSKKENPLTGEGEGRDKAKGEKQKGKENPLTPLQKGKERKSEIESEYEWTDGKEVLS